MWIKYIAIILLLTLNLKSCAKVGIFDSFSGKDVQTVIVNNDGIPICDMYKNREAGEKPYEYVSANWVWCMAITYGLLCGLNFLPYVWLFWGLLILFTLGQINALRK